MASTNRRQVAATGDFVASEATLLVSVSGGRTSGYMARWIQQNRDTLAGYLEVDTVRPVYVFANTGAENEDTLRFLHDMDREFGLGIVWVEAVVHPGERKGSTHRVVSYSGAMRLEQWRDALHPFHAVIAKYGIPNTVFRPCTRELKQNPIASYMRSLGLAGTAHYHTALGIRVDERRRVAKTAEAQNIIYPLVDLEPSDKGDILDWWRQFSWDLKIPEWQGNCVTCHHKSILKLRAVHQETPEAFEFNAGMERYYRRVGAGFPDPDKPDRLFFRSNLTTGGLLKLFEDPSVRDYPRKPTPSACSAQCEMFEMEFY